MSYTIIIKMEGMPEENGHVSLWDFISQLQAFNNTLRKLDLEAGDGKYASKFQIIALSHSSPAIVTVDQRPLPKRPDTSVSVRDNFEKLYTSIKRGVVPKNIDPELVDNVKLICRPIGRTIRETQVHFNGSHLDFNPQFKTHLDGFLASEEEYFGAVSGKLEKLDIHKGKNIFTIYPQFGPAKVDCKFPKEMIDDAIMAVNKKVEVRGILKYYPDNNFPHLIEARSLDVFPPENELADFDDLLGKAPDITGGLSSEEYVRGLRDAWI